MEKKRGEPRGVVASICNSTIVACRQMMRRPDRKGLLKSLRLEKSLVTSISNRHEVPSDVKLRTGASHDPQGHLSTLTGPGTTASIRAVVYL